MRRTVLYISEILAWADEHRERKGQFPTANSGRVAGRPDEKWANIEQALRLGLRGLPGRWSLAQLLAERRGHRNRKRLPKFTQAKILDWADAHKRRTGRWPMAKSGPIHDAPGETWLAVNIALNHGQRGLAGGSSLARLLAKRRRARNRTAVPKLSIQRILQWADAHMARTGNWPVLDGGLIPESRGETWTAINHALRRGNRGLRGGTTLARLLLERRGVRRHFRHVPLSIEQILQWADAHKGRTGRWPNAASGRIRESTGETWGRVQTALYQAKRSLPPGWSLAKILAKHRGVRNHLGLPPLSERSILRWAAEHHSRNGKLPTRDSGAVPNSNGETWAGVDSALKAGCRGLPGGSSLARLLAKKFARHPSS